MANIPQFTLMTAGMRLADKLGGPYNADTYRDAQEQCEQQSRARGITTSIWHLDAEGWPLKPVAGFNSVHSAREGWLN